MMLVKGISVGIVIILILVGVALGLSYSKAEFLHPRETEMTVKEREAELQVRQAQAVREQQRQSNLDEIERSRALALARQDLESRARLAERIEEVIVPATVLLLLGVLSMLLGLTFYLVSHGIAKLRTHRAAGPSPASPAHLMPEPPSRNGMTATSGRQSHGKRAA